MFRALLELVVTIILAMAARAIISSLMKGFSNAARGESAQARSQTSTQYDQPPQPKTPPRDKVPVTGELHKDPVCGMYVSEATRFQRKGSRESFYYCSEECKEKHALAAR